MRRDAISSLKVGPESVRTIYNGILDDPFWRRLEGECPVSLDLLSGKKLVVTVGRLVPQKNHKLLIEAFADAFHGTRDHHLLVVGDGPELEALRTHCSGQGQEKTVTFTGFVENPLPLLKRCEVFALSSDHEGLPSALIEALAAGCEVVSTDCRSGPSEILENGRFGYLVPVRDRPALAAALQNAMASAEGGHRRNKPEALQRFSVARMTDGYEQLFMELSPAARRDHGGV
jgi:glycosyltransferase involved in cell wall biosynthesis